MASIRYRYIGETPVNVPDMSWGYDARAYPPSGRELQIVAHDLHHVHGYTWQDIGRAAGISKQAAEQRWG